MNTYKKYNVEYNGINYSYQLHSNTSSNFHEVVIKNANGKEVHLEIDYIPTEEITEKTFRQWVEIGMPTREEYHLTSLGDDDTLELTPLDAEKIDELYRLYKGERAA